MATARFKDLCIDAADARRLGGFWAKVLGRRLLMHDDGDAQLDGERPEERIWINVVPEPRTVKHRVHLDVATDDPGALRKLGATVLRASDDEIDWTVMADVEGGEFCAVPRGQAGRLLTLTIDAVDARSQARWWGEVLDSPVARYRDGWWFVRDIPTAPFRAMLFIEVPEPKTIKNRVHWDLTADDHQALVKQGARVLREPDNVIDWWVLADPEGNEFCAFHPTG
jgi:hypothetical protein